MFRIAAILTTATFVLSACASSVTMNAASFTRFDDGLEWIMYGELIGNEDGSSITRLSGNGINCEMHMTRQADQSTAGVMTCTDDAGLVIYNERQFVPAEDVTTSRHGTYVSEITTPIGHGIMAFGWGSNADPAILRTLLPQ